MKGTVMASECLFDKFSKKLRIGFCTSLSPAEASLCTRTPSPDSVMGVKIDSPQKFPLSAKTPGASQLTEASFLSYQSLPQDIANIAGSNVCNIFLQNESSILTE
jgi:hypothetical protein